MLPRRSDHYFIFNLFLIFIFSPGVYLKQNETTCLKVIGLRSCNKMSCYAIEPITEVLHNLGEGPHWDIETQSLYFVDIYDASVHRYDYKERKVYSSKIANETMVSFIIPVEGMKDRFVVGIGRRVGIIQWDGCSPTCRVERIAYEIETEDEYKDNRFNDGKADPRGRLFAGTMRLEILGDMFNYKQGSLYTFVKGLPANRLRSNVGISNGLAFNEKKGEFYYIDSTAYTVEKYNYNVSTGEISNPKVLVNLKGQGNFVPDGMTIDRDGFLYVALWGGSKIYKINPTNGNIECEIPFPCEQVTSAAFGGPNLDILFVTTAAKDGKPSPAGKTFKVTGLGAVGLPMSRVNI